MSKSNKMNRIRTKGYRSQNDYDNFISDLTENELVVLNNKYNRDLIYYRIHQDLNIQENAQEYKEMQQRKKMLDEEIKKRKMFRTPTSSSLWFNIENGTVLDSNNNVVEKIAFNSDETEIVKLPSGNKEEIDEGWVNLSDTLDDEPDFDYSFKNEVELSWKEWCNKKQLIHE